MLVQPMMRCACALTLVVFSWGITPASADEGAKARPNSAQVAKRVDGTLNRAASTTPLADDATFFRRVSLDLTGKVPTPLELKTFLADADPHKRTKLIDRLLA